MNKLLVLLALTCFASSAFAINDTGTNSLGVYFDPDFSTNCVDYVPATPFPVYFVMANCTAEAVGGFEFAWAMDPEPVGNYFILGTVLPPDALNIGDNFNLIVGIGAPYLTDTATVLVEFSMMVLAPGITADITVGPSVPASIAGETAFVSGESELFAMNFSTFDGEFVTRDSEGWVRPGIGNLGCPAPIAIEKQSWGSVKALFK